MVKLFWIWEDKENEKIDEQPLEKKKNEMYDK